MKRDVMLEAMPHRGRNVLIDDYRDSGENAGEGRLTIAEDDPAGRDIFLVRGPSGMRYGHLFLVEHCALNSVLILRADMGGGRLAYFSTISKYRRRGEAAAGTPLVSRVVRGRDRREFRTFRATVETEAGDPVLEVGFMAYLAARDAAPPVADPDRERVEAPRPDPAEFPCLDPSLCFLADLGGGEYGAVYPEDHPLCAGHFPGAPVMMGMTQWLAVAERAALLAPPGEETVVSGSGALTTADGSPVVDISGLTVAVTKDEDGRVADLRPLATKRVAFRERILPGDLYRATFEPA